jgi:hypothetical protein
MAGQFSGVNAVIILILLRHRRISSDGNRLSALAFYRPLKQFETGN